MEHPADIAVRLGHRIRKLRLERNITQEEFSARSGINRTYLSDVERGVRNVTIRNIEIIAQTLNVTLSDLMEGLDRPSARPSSGGRPESG